MVARQEENWLEGDQFTAFGSFNFDDDEDDDMLQEDRVDRRVIDPYLDNEGNDGGIPVSESDG